MLADTYEVLGAPKLREAIKARVGVPVMVTDVPAAPETGLSDVTEGTSGAGASKLTTLTLKSCIPE